MNACRNCGETIPDQADFCGGHCRAAHRKAVEQDSGIDWLAVRLRQQAIRSGFAGEGGGAYVRSSFGRKSWSVPTIQLRTLGDGDE